MHYSDKDRKRFVKMIPVFNNGVVCNCCLERKTFQGMWMVNRFNSDGTHSPWYYCTTCFETKDEILEQVATDEYPYGIYPTDFESVKDSTTWKQSLSDVYSNRQTEEKARPKYTSYLRQKVKLESYSRDDFD